MTSIKQDKDFMQTVIIENISSEMLTLSIEWITNNLAPDEVFSEKQLQEWAERNGYAKEE